MADVATFAGLAGYLWLALFQVLLAAGAPLGRMAWRGAHRVLPPPLRWASLASGVLGLVGALTVAQAGGIVSGILPAILVRPLLGMFAVLFAMSVLANLLGANGIERLHGVPLALVCAVSAAVLAAG